MKETEYLYRFVDAKYSVSSGYDDDHYYTQYAVRIDRYEVLSHTPCGVWIRTGFFKEDDTGKKFVNLKARKRFGALTKEAALEQYMFRKNRQIKILEAQLRGVEKMRRIAGIMINFPTEQTTWG